MTRPFAFLSRRLALAALLLLAAARSGPARAEVLTLADCLRETLEHNPDVRRQRAGLELAAGTRLTLRARSLPSLTVGGIAGQLGAENDEVITQRTKNKTTGAVTTTQVVAVRRGASFILLGTGSIYQTLFDAAIPASYRRGTAEVLAAQESFYAVASGQLHAARGQFLQALYQQQYEALLRRIDANYGEDITAQSHLAAAGLAGRAGLLSARVQRASFAPNIIGAAGTYRTTLAQLLQTMGREAGTPEGVTLAGSLDETAFSFDTADAAREALARRPDVRLLRALATEYREEGRIARGGYYPLIRLYVAGEALPQTSTRSNNPNAVRATDQVQTTELRPGVQGSWAVIDTGAVRGAAGQDDAVRGIYELSVQRLERNVPAELAAVRARLDAAAATAAALGGNVDAAQNTLGIVQAGLAQGVNSQLEFLDAQTGLLSTQIGLLAARLALSVQRAEFDRLTGNYLRYVTDDAPVSKVRSSAAPLSNPRP